jgi:tripartite-type tricarboxylate transporter receptor subunit TctC
MNLVAKPMEYKMERRGQAIGWLTAACSVLLTFGLPAGESRAADYPSRPITILVPFAAGGSSDVVMRLVAQKAAESMNQTIIIDNRPGGAGNVAAVTIKNAAPDGYLLMMGHTGTHAVNPSLYSDLKFDPVRDFEPVVPLTAFSNIMVVPDASPARSAGDIIALAKNRPDGLIFGSPGIGTGGHLMGSLLSKNTGAKFIHVPYRGVAPALTDLVAGRADFMFAAYISAVGHIQGGSLRMLAIAAERRHPLLPDLPTMAEAGYPEATMVQWFGLFAPAGTPASVVQRLNAEFIKALQHDEVQKATRDQAVDILSGTPEDLGALVRRDIERLGRIVRDSGAQAQ